MKKMRLSAAAAFLILSLMNPLFSDTREENIDLFVVLDKSLSMVEEIDSVKNYVENFLVDSFIIPGDSLTIINFFGSAETLITRKVDSASAKAMINSELDKIRADGRYTDIGNALDVLKREVEKHPDTGRKKYLLLITDGIQEAPPDSIYYSPDGKFNHYFLENTKTIQRSGWKIQIIGIGDATAAREVAEELSGAYAEIEESRLTPGALEEATLQLTGLIEPAAPPRFSRLDKEGYGKMELTLKSSGYSVPREIALEGFYFRSRDYDKWDLLSGTEDSDAVGGFLNFSLAPGEEKTFTVPLRFPLPASGEKTLEGSVFFVFAGDTPVTPAVFEVTVDGPFRIPLWIFIAAGILILAALIVFLVLRLSSRDGSAKSSGGTLTVSCQFSGSREVSRNFTLENSETVTVIRSGFVLDFTKEPAEDGVALVRLSGQKLLFELLQAKELKPISGFGGNILGRELQFTLSGGQSITLSFKKSE